MSDKQVFNTKIKCSNSTKIKVVKKILNTRKNI